MRKTTLLTTALLATAGGCTRDIVDSDPSTIGATVRLVGIEGGCWILDADNGTRYEPIGLPDKYRVNGRRVRVTVKPRTNASSTCMVGDLVDIVTISE